MCLRSFELVVLFLSVVCAFPADSGTADSQSRGQKGYAFGKPGINATFDYVVIGGGTAGLTIATRLAENPDLSVAVIEAGGFYEQDNGNISVVPGTDSVGAGPVPGVGVNPLVDWNFNTTPQAGANDRILHYARGKTLGGSSARNFLYYHRPSSGSMQKWADTVNDQSFTFANLLKYYKKSVDFTPPQIRYPNSTNEQDPNAFSQSGGPLQVSFGRYDDPFGTWVQHGLRSIGQALIKGFSSGILMGTSYMAFSEDPTQSHRSSSESSFLESTKDIKTQLTVYKNTLAERIIFSGANNCADGVVVAPEGEFAPDGNPYALFARKEVILSAGVFQSPQMLMVSGIGPKSTLKQHGIKVLKDLPGVGQNLWDHVYYGSSYRVNLAALPSTATQTTEYDQVPATGPLTNPGNPNVGWDSLPESYQRNLTSSTRQALATFPSDWPVVEWLPISAGLGNGTEGVYASMATALIAPLSRGNVTISSARMADAPIINPNWLTNPADMEVAVAAFKRQREFWSKLKAITIGPENFPGPTVQTDAEILNFIRETLVEVWHASATCKMGVKNDPMAVVDTSFRVFGTAQLRIVDASAFPFLPPGHPQSTVYALAEKLAAQILQGN